MAKISSQNVKDVSSATNQNHAAHRSDREDESDNEAEAETFNAATHIQFMKDNMVFFGCTFEEWVVFLIKDNCSTNRKISVDTSKPLVGCLSHKLNLQVNKMIRCMPDLNRQIETVHKSMSAAKALKHSAMLRNLTDLSPVLPNATMWSGKSEMLTRFVPIRDELVQASDESPSPSQLTAPRSS